MNSSRILGKKESAIAIVVGLLLFLCCVAGSNYLCDKFHITRYVVTASCLFVAFSFLAIKQKELLLPKSKLLYIYLIFIVLSGVSMLWATEFGESVFAFSKLVITFLTTLLVYDMLQKDRHAAKKALWIASTAILIVYLVFAVVQMIEIKDNSFKQLYNVSGISGHKNLLSIMLFVLSAFSLTSVPEIKNRFLKIIPVALFIISLIIIILLKSRAVILSSIFAIVFFVIICLLRKNNVAVSAKVKTIVSIVLFAVVFAFFTVLLRFISEKSIPLTSEKSEIEYNILSTSSLAERFIIWNKSYKIVDNHPFTGCGIGNWQIEFPNCGLKGLYRADIWNVNFTKPHNEYLGMLSECGYVVFAVHCAFLCLMIVFPFFSICSVKDKKDFVFGAVVLSILFGYCVNAVFDYPSSRIECVIWIGIIYAILFDFITKDNSLKINKIYNVFFALISLFILVIGIFRYNGERAAFDMQKAIKCNDWEKVEKFAHRSISTFYKIDPLGMPLHWYLGKAEDAVGNPLALLDFRKAYKYAPYCKENLNDLGLAEYHTNCDVEKSTFYLKEAFRVSPNFLYPYFNLANIYLNEGRYAEAKSTVDLIYMDENKRDVMIGDIGFFEPDNVDAIRNKIEMEYVETVRLRTATDSLARTILNSYQKE